MEQFGNFVRPRIDAGQVRSFMQVAIDTGKGEVVGIVSAAMNLRNDMLDMQCGQRRVVLAQLTILAGVLGAFADLSSRPRSDHRWAGLADAGSLPSKNGDKLVCANETRVLRPFLFCQLAFC
jgi:hypothetical protein